MAQNYPKWLKNDARIYALFPQFFLTEKSGSANFFANRMYGYDFDYSNLMLVMITAIYYSDDNGL